MDHTTLTQEEYNRRYAATLAILADMIADLPAAAVKTEEAEEMAEVVNVLDRSIQ